MLPAWLLKAAKSYATQLLINFLWI